MTINYFVAKRDSKFVKKLIRWSLYTYHIVSLLEIAICLTVICVIAYFDGHEDRLIS